MSASAPITMYGLKSCDSCRKARAWTAERGLPVSLRDVREDGLDQTTLRRWLRQVEWTDLLNKRSTTWRQLPDARKTDLNQDRALALIARHPTLLKRPVLEYGDELIVGFSPTAYEAVFGP